MKRPPALRQVAARFAAREAARRTVSALASDALNHAKRAIFALHREDAEGAIKLLTHVGKQIDACEKTLRTFPELRYDGVYRAALEEYTEALIFVGFLSGGSLTLKDKRLMEPEVYLSGLSDATGEMVRFALRQATKGNVDAIRKTADVVETIISYLYELDLTGYLRTKFDQAKKNLRSLEQMLYDARSHT